MSVVASAHARNEPDFTLRIPAEVLCACLSFLQFSDILVATRVSAHWRSVALYEPALWNEIPIGHRWHPNFLRMLIARAAALPLHIRATLPSHELAEELVAHIHQVASLDITTDIFNILARTPRAKQRRSSITIWISEAPVLRRLRLVSTSASTVTIPAEMFACHPGIETLELSAFRLPVRCPALRSLLHFTGTIEHSNATKSNIHALFDLCPELRSLTLYVECTLDRSSTLPSRPPPSFSHLQLHSKKYLDLRIHLQGFAGRNVPLISVNGTLSTPKNKEFLLERLDTFDRIEVMEVDCGILALRLCDAPSAGGNAFQFTDLSELQYQRLVWELSPTSRFQELTTVSVWHSFLPGFLLGCPPLPKLRCIEGLAPAFVSELRTYSGGPTPPEPIIDMTAAWRDWSHDPEDDASEAGLFSKPCVYRFPAWTTFVFRTVAARPGRKPFARLGVLCRLVAKETDPAAAPRQRTFRLAGIDIAEPVVAAETLELARLFDDIELTNVKFGVEVRKA